MTAPPRTPAPVDLDPLDAALWDAGYLVGRLGAVLDDLSAALCRLTQQVDDGGSLDLAAQLALLGDLQDRRTHLAQLAALQEARAARVMPADTVEGPGFVAVRRGGAARKAWDHAALESLVAARVADEVVDPATGEAVPRHLVDELVQLVLAARTRGPWSTRGLRRLGIDPDAHAAVEYGRHTVVVTRGAAPTPNPTPLESDA